MHIILHTGMLKVLIDRTFVFVCEQTVEKVYYFCILVPYSFCIAACICGPYFHFVIQYGT